MREPVARATAAKPSASDKTNDRSPRAFDPAEANVDLVAPEQALDTPSTFAPPTKRDSWWGRLALGAGGLLVSLGLALAAERLISDLFARYEWLGWAGFVLTILFVVAVAALLIRELLALRRLANLDTWRQEAALVTAGGSRADGQRLVARLQALYQTRPDLAQARRTLDLEIGNQFDGPEMIAGAERHLMAPLDTRARALTTAASRRVALVTAVSPRALVDLLFVAYESFKLIRAISALYGGRPGLFSGWKLGGAVLSHLAITGGVALGDSVIQQLLGQGLAARLSARLGEGLVNGLMTARVGIAAMQVTRPLPFHALKQPQVMDFALDLGKIARQQDAD